MSGEVNLVTDKYARRIREDFVYLFPPFVKVFEGFTPCDIEDVNNASGTTIKVLTDNLELRLPAQVPDLTVNPHSINVHAF